MDKKTVHYVSMSLLWFGGINWGLYGILNIDLIQMFFGSNNFGQLVYILIGAAAVYNFSVHKTECNVCSVSKSKK